MPTRMPPQTPQSPVEYLLQMKIPEEWDNNSFKDLLIQELLKEEKRLKGGNISMEGYRCE